MTASEPSRTAMAMSETSARVGVGWTWRCFYSLDMSILDFDISYSISFVVCAIFEVFAVIVMMAIVTWKVLIVAIPVMIIMVFVQFVFSDGQMNLDRLKHLILMIEKRRLILDLRCRRKNGKYAIVTDRWQKFTDVFLD